MSLRTALSVPRASAIATSSRCFTTSQQVLAGGKGPKKSNITVAGKRKTTASFSSKDKGNNKNIMGPMSRGIKLSYAMASPPPDLSDFAVFNEETLSSANVGLPTTFARQTIDAIKVFGLPRRLEKELTSAGLPASVIRQATLDLLEMIKSGSTSSSAESRYMLSGDRGSGKSLLLVQAVAQALATNHIVIYAPQTLRWIDSTSTFAYDATSQTFHQPALAKSWLESILKVNGSKLNQLTIGDEGKNLVEYAREVIRDETRTVEGLEKLLEAVAAQDKFPVFMGFDDVQTLFTQSRYRTPQFETLQAYNLSMPRLALDYISGRKQLTRGTIISAYSHTTAQVPPSLTFLYGFELPSSEPITPYTSHDPVHLAHATSSIQKINVPFGMTTKEANGMFEIWSRKGWAPKSNDELFMGVYASSLGNPKDLARSLWDTRMAFEQFDPRVGESRAGI